MATWNPPSDANLAPDKPGKPSLFRAIRDLPQALAEQASGAPWINRSGALEILGPELSPKLTAAPWYGFYSLEFDWVVPEDVWRIDVILIGGGGCGGAGIYEGDISDPTTGGGGGGGGGAMVRQVLEVTPCEVHHVKLGAGGWPSAVHPSVDILKDDFETGDGARTEFGDLVAAGGKHGLDGDIANRGAGGDGGGSTDAGDPTVVGGDGEPGFLAHYGILASLGGSGVAFGGRGGNSYFGDGAPRKHTVGNGKSFYANSSDTVPGAGGGGGASDTTLIAYTGGRGANGLVIVRY